MKNDVLNPSTKNQGPAGLTSAQVAERVERGQVNRLPDAPRRTVGEIIKANVVTRFNLILGMLVVLILAIAPIQDALFGLVLIVNAAIVIVQELRAKKTLEQLQVINEPRVEVIRDAVAQAVPVERVVLGDLIAIRAGDQLVVDGAVASSTGLEVDESLLTGESDPVPKPAGSECRSGSFVVAGSGTMTATRVGADSYASRLALEARKFTLVNSELKRGIDVILAVIGWSLIPIGGLLVFTQRNLEGGLTAALSGAVAGMVAMIPQGLVLLTSIAFAVAVVRLGRRRVLVQELPAVEILARVDTICFDKTGTITEGHLRLLRVEPASQGSKSSLPQDALGAMSRADPAPNSTLAALHAATTDPGWTATRLVAFSSARGWSGVAFDGQGTWFLGVPEILVGDHPALLRRAQRSAQQGYRVLALSHGPDGATHPDAATPMALVVLGDDPRPEAADTIAYFRKQGVEAKVISGDHPATVAAMAARVGLRDPLGAFDGADFPTDPAHVAAVARRHRVFGRITPHQKRLLIESLQDEGHVVAMTGDGVNDVLALKHADIGIAMGSGSPASRAVAQIVLLDANFDTLPGVVEEGRRIIANIERVANLFLTKTVYAVLLAIATAVTQLAFPFLPRHLTLIGSLTIGIPGFFLALEKTSTRFEAGFLRRVWRFAVPTGTLSAAASFAVYGLAQSEAESLEASRAAATLVLAAVGLFALAVVGRPLTAARQALLASMGLLMLLTVFSPALSEFYALPLPRPAVLLAGVGIAALTGSIMYLALRMLGWYRAGVSFFSEPASINELRRSARAVAHRIGSRLTDPARVTPTHTESGQTDSGPVDSGPVDSGLVDSGLVDSGRVDSGRVERRKAPPGNGQESRMAAGHRTIDLGKLSDPEPPPPSPAPTEQLSLLRPSGGSHRSDRG